MAESLLDPNPDSTRVDGLDSEEVLLAKGKVGIYNSRVRTGSARETERKAIQRRRKATGLDRFGEDIDLHGDICGVALGTGTGGHDLDRVTLAAARRVSTKRQGARRLPMAILLPFFDVWILHCPEKFRPR